MNRHASSVLIVDDSASVRQTLSAILSGDPDIEVMGAASDAYAAARRLQAELPDVMILDIEMPGMDGLTFLRKIMAQRPIPVIICSTLTEQGSEAAVRGARGGRGRHHAQAARRHPQRRCWSAASAYDNAVKAAALAKVRPREAPRWWSSAS